MAKAHSQPVPVATLPGTNPSFPIAPEKLIDVAKKLASSTKPPGVDDPSVLSDDFRFEFPVVKLSKKEYLKAVSTFDFSAGIPDLESHPYDFRVDKYEPQRVWYTIRNTGRHTGTLAVFKYKYKPTNLPIQGCPEAMSFTFDANGKVTSFSGGYVMDNRLGTSNKLGGLFGILQSIGIFVPFPQPNTLGWRIGSAVDTGVNLLKAALHFVSFGVFRQKPKTA